MVLLYSLYKLIYFIFGDMCLYDGDVVCVSRLVVSDSLQPHELQPARVLCGILQARILEWVAVSFSREWNLPDPGLEPWSPALQADFLPSELQGSPKHYLSINRVISSMENLKILSLPQYYCCFLTFQVNCVCMYQDFQSLGYLILFTLVQILLSRECQFIVNVAWLCFCFK